ncbi:MAG: hypothetical protein II821_05785 [Treponema sp.]|nr:hypothetical protein [Treponema sp.]
MKIKSKLAICVSFALLAGNLQTFGITMKARAILTGNLAEETQKKGSDKKYEFFKLNSKPQKDDDGLVIEVSDANWGGRLALWYQFDASMNKLDHTKATYAEGSDGTRLNFRRTNLWFKLFPTLKFTVGYVGNDQLYKERIDDWKVGNPFKYDTRAWKEHPGYANNSDVDEMGLSVESRPMDGLILTAAIARKWGQEVGTFGSKAFWTKNGDGDPEYCAWGASARYYPGHNLCFQAAYRDNGTKDFKIARCAIGYEGNGIYAFAQPCFGIDWDRTENKYELSGICFDLYGEYTFDSWTFLAHVPVTLRLTGDDGDPSYLEYLVQAKYNLGKFGNMEDFTPNIKVGTRIHDGDQKEAFIRFDDFSKTLNFDITPGVEFSVASCEFSIGFEMLFHSDYAVESGKYSGHEKFEWRVPFSAEIKL